jgi:predicted kinase
VRRRRLGQDDLGAALESRGLVRLSIDEEIWSRFGRYGLNYDPVEYGAHQDVARADLDVKLNTLLERGTSAVLDYSFWRREERDRYRMTIERHSRPCRLLVLHVELDILRRRLIGRQATVDANGAFTITDGLLDSYLAGFEWPQNEGETVLPA